MPERKIHTARLVHAAPLSLQARHLEFEVQAGGFDFSPGQFLSFLALRDGREITHPYSIASAPCNARFDLCLNRVDDSFFANLLCDMREGETLRFHGPHGLFVLRSPVRDSIFIAVGTGIAPMRGFIQWLFADPARTQGREFWLVYGCRREEDIYYREDFEALASRHRNFHYLATLSRAEDRWKGPRGYVQEHVRGIVERLGPAGIHQLQAYICGSKEMVRANRDLLAELGMNRKSIVYELYDE